MSQFRRSSFYALSALAVFSIVYFSSFRSAAALQAGTVAITSAASYDLNIAPESIATVFGANLAASAVVGTDSDPNTPGIQLPKTLAGVSVDIGGVAAGLFFVSPGQINLQVPSNVALGAQPVVARNGAIVSNGTAQIVNVAPGVFSFNATSRGVAAGSALRIRNSVATYEDIATLVNDNFVTKPIDLGPSGDEVYLTIYGTGFRRAAAGTARVALAGVEYTPQFAGTQGTFVGLDQVNILVPRSLLGTGRINITLNVTGATPANTVEAEIAGATGSAAPTVTNPAGPVVAADAIIVNGSGFAANAADNLVRIGGVEAQVLSGNASALNVRVPFGAETGAVTVRTAQGEGRSGGALQVKTSVSGIIETTDRQPLNNVRVRGLVGLTQFNGTTGTGGAFVLSELPGNGSIAFVSIDGSSINTTPAYGSLTLNQSYLAARDNQFASPIALQQVSGTSGQVGGSGFAANEDEPLSLTTDVYATAKELPREAWPTEILNSFQPTPDDAVIRFGEVTLTLPGNPEARFLDGSNRGLVTLTQVESSRTPVSLPGGVFSSAIIQITPFGTSFGRGGTLRFPNTERYPAGTQVRVYRLDQRATSLTRGRFIQAGFATVSQDALTILTDPGVVIEATYYFVGLPRTITNVVGRVLDANRTPLRRALVRLRGQEAFTDGNGGFTLRNVPVSNVSDLIIVEASYARANGRVDRAFSNRIAPVISGFTNVGDIVMPAVNANQPPVIVVASSLTANAAQTNDFNFLAYDPDETRTPVLAVSGATFASVIAPTAQTPAMLRLTPTANQLGSFTLTLTATDSQSAVTTRTITVRVVNANRAPVANAQRVVTDEDTPIQFTLTGSDPDQDQLKFLLVTKPVNGNLSGIFPALTFTPPLNFNGTDSFTFRVTDGQLDSALATVTLVVNPVNDAPVLTVPATQTVAAGQPLNFTVSATDADAGQTLTFNATNSPAGASFNAATRQFSWTPVAAQGGTFNVTFTVIDNGVPSRSDAKSVTINVTGGITGWQQTSGPDGGSVRNLAVSGNAVLATTDQGFIFRSTDGGVSWTEVLNTGLFEIILELTTTGTRVYALTTTRIYSSNDNGVTWSSTAATFPSGLVTALAANGNNVFIGLVTEALATRGVYRSTDSGASWAISNTGISDSLITALAVSGTNLIAGSAGGFVYRSINNGTNWSAVTLNQTLLSVDDAVASGTNFYLAADTVILRSTDGGATFTNFGNTGEATASSLHLEGATLYVATLNNGVYRIDANGSTVLGSQGLFTLETSDVAVIGTTLLASNLATGVYRSTIAGQSWSASNAGVIATLATTLAAGNGNVFCGVLSSSAFALGAIARTSDNGKTWNRTALPNAAAAPTALAYGNNALIVGWSGAGLFRSTDNGVTFTTVAATIGLTDTRSLLANGASMYAGTATGFYRSTDSGATWAKLFSSTGPIISLSLTGTTLYAGVAAPAATSSGGGLLRSVDNGTNWTSVALPQAVTNVVQVGTTLLASVIPNQNSPAGAFRSVDNGATWQAADSGLPTNFNFKLLPVGASVYAATGAGVFVTNNAGQSWTAFNEGLRNLFVPTLVLNGNILFAATGGSGVWARQLAP